MNFGAGVSNSKNPSPLRPIELPIIPAGNKSSFREEPTKKLQLYEYETDRYILQNFQCTTLLIHEFCKICEHEIVLQESKSKQKQFQVHNSYKTREWSNKVSYYFWKKEENMDLSHINLAVFTIYPKNKINTG